MKKIIFIILVLCLVFQAGCGSAADPEAAGASPNMNGDIAEETEGSEASGTGSAGQDGAKVDPPSPPSVQGTSAGGGTQKTDPAKPSGGGIEGDPAPVEPLDAGVDKKTELHCTLAITCRTILDNLDRLDQAKQELVPEDGVIYRTEEAVFYEGENVFDVLLRETRQNKIHMEFVGTPGYSGNYVEGINNIYEFDCGELSGWMYKVNDWFPNYGSSRYVLKDGDRIEWIYTCDLGRDIGGDWNAQNRIEEQ